MTNSRQKKQKFENKESSVDSHDNKENNMPSILPKKNKIEGKKGLESNEKKKLVQITAKSSSEKVSKHKTSNSKKLGEKVISIESSDQEEDNQKPSVKRLSLKKKEVPYHTESGSKVSVRESNKENSELIKTPTSSDLPRNSYGLRRRGRGRQPKKSHIYKNNENIIFSHEKDEEMNKLDDSEFKLPNEDKSKEFRNIFVDLEASKVIGSPKDSG